MFSLMNSLVALILVISILLVGFILPAPVPVQILLYRVLSGILAILILWTALVDGNAWKVLLIAIPIGFAILIGWIASKIVGSNNIVKLTREQWMTCYRIGLALIALTIAVIPLFLAHREWDRTLQLVTSLAFVLVGMCIWLVRKNLISQAIGLLVMDDGLFLLSESVFNRIDMTSILLLTLFLYLLVPLIYLLRVMPQLGQKTLDADQFRELRG